MKKAMLLHFVMLFIFTVSSLSQQTTSAPSIPEEARRHFVIATTLFKEAKTPDDYQQVIENFKQTVDLAPQWPEARYNLALAKEAAGDFAGAIVDLKLYLQFKLPDAEARTAQDKMYALEAKADLAAKKKAETEKAAAEEKRKVERKAESIRIAEKFRGAWYMYNCIPSGYKVVDDPGCNFDETQGSNWRRMMPMGGGGVVNFEINDGVIKLSDFTSWAGCKGPVYGVVGDSEIYIKWEERRTDGTVHNIWWSLPDMYNHGQITISCERDDSDDLTIKATDRYRYIMFTRNPL